jgi:hypothetical protein
MNVALFSFIFKPKSWLSLVNYVWLSSLNFFAFKSFKFIILDELCVSSLVKYLGSRSTIFSFDFIKAMKKSHLKISVL